MIDLHMKNLIISFKLHFFSRWAIFLLYSLCTTKVFQSHAFHWVKFVQPGIWNKSICLRDRNTHFWRQNGKILSKLLKDFSRDIFQWLDNRRHKIDNFHSINLECKVWLFSMFIITFHLSSQIPHQRSAAHEKIIQTVALQAISKSSTCLLKVFLHI